MTAASFIGPHRGGGARKHEVVFGEMAEAVSISLMARQFLRGFPPHWTVAASDIPVALEASKALFSALAHAVNQNEKLFVVAVMTPIMSCDDLGCFRLLSIILC